MNLPKGTFLAIDLDALVSNYHFFRNRIGAKTKIIAVIKAFAYGHEATAIAKKLESEGVAYFAVAYTKEGIALRKAGISTPILVLHPQIADIQACLEHQLEPTIYNFTILEFLQKITRGTSGKKIKIHLKFNTGLNRLGFVMAAIDRLVASLEKSDELEVASVYSHLVASEDPEEKDFTKAQIKAYKAIVKALDKKLPQAFQKHLANTSGVINYPEAHFDMVRMGIGLYGYANDTRITNQLHNVASLYTRISQIHTLEPGQSVGYNRAFVTDKKIQTATLPIGHADGIPRTWGNKVNYVTIKGKKAPIIGNVCMDMIMVDVSGIVCKEGDVVTIFDTQNTLEELATNSGTISYEVLTAISQRVERVLIHQEK